MATTAKAKVKHKDTAMPLGIAMGEMEAAGANPFVNETYPMDCCERLKIVFMLVSGIFLVRLLLFLCCFLSIALCAIIGTCGVKSTDTPLRFWRHCILAPIPYFWRGVLFSLGYWYIPMTILDGPDSPRRSCCGLGYPKVTAPVIVANHVASFEVMALSAFHNPSFVGMKPIQSMPLLGSIANAVQTLFVDRKTAKGRSGTIDAIKKRLSTPGFPPLCIFPEGCTSSDKNLTVFKRGPFLAGRPVQPIGFRYPFRRHDVAWVSVGPSLPYIMARCMCQFYNTMEITYLPKHIPTPAEVSDAWLYANNVRADMAKALNCRLSKHSFGDVRLLLKMGAYAQNVIENETDVHTVQVLTGLKLKGVMSLAKHFKDADVDRDGALSLDELSAALKKSGYSGAQVAMSTIFALLDHNNDGLVDFRELVLGISIASQHVTETQEVMKLAFAVYDRNSDGVLSKSEVSQMFAGTRRLTLQAKDLPDDLSGKDSEASKQSGLGEAIFEHWPSGKSSINFEEFCELSKQHPELVKAVEKMIKQSF